MSRLTLAGFLVALILAAVAVILLGPVAFAKSRNVIVGRPTPPPKSARTLRRTWKSGPASTPPEEEIVSRRAPFPSPVRPLRASVEERSTIRPAKNLGERVEATPDPAVSDASARAKHPTRRGLPGAARSGITAVDASASQPTRPDPDARARADLACLRDDPKARQAFYDNLLRTADRVRAGEVEPEPRGPSPCSAFAAGQSPR